MDMLDQLNVGIKLNDEELLNIYGGTKISSSLISGFTSSFKVLYEIGQNFGTSIRRIIFNDLCSL